MTETINKRINYWTEELKEKTKESCERKKAEVMDRVIWKRCNKCNCQLDNDKFHAQAWGLKCYDCFREMMNQSVRKQKERIKCDPEEYIKNKFHVYIATAKQRWVEWDVSLEVLMEIYRIQEGRCLFTGVELQTCDEKQYVDYLTLDRLDNNIWYISGNVAFVSREFNQMIKKNIPIEFIEEHMPKIYKMMNEHCERTKSL